MLPSNQIFKGSLWATESWSVKLLGNLQQNSYMILIGNVFTHAVHASQLRYYYHKYSSTLYIGMSMVP